LTRALLLFFPEFLRNEKIVGVSWLQN